MSDEPVYSLKIKELPAEDRPRERLLALGAGALSNAELIALIIGFGVKGQSATAIGQHMLQQHGGLGGLMRLQHEDLDSFKGLGPAKAAKLLAALELGRRAGALAPDSRPLVGTPEDVALLLGGEMSILPQEQLRVVNLDTKHRIVKTTLVYQGTVNSASVRPAELFRDAVKVNAVSIILVHNHPSGDPTPSSNDVMMTREAVRAGQLLDISVLDHIVIGQGRHASLKRLGLGFE